jgi:hypothetical protein
LSQPVSEGFDIVVAAVMAAEGESHVLSTVDLDIFKKGEISQGQYFVLTEIAQKDAAALLVLRPPVDDIIIIVVDQQFYAFHFNKKLTLMR